MLEPYHNTPYQEEPPSVWTGLIIGAVLGIIGGGVAGYLIGDKLCIAKAGLEAGESIISKIVKEI